MKLTILLLRAGLLALLTLPLGACFMAPGSTFKPGMENQDRSWFSQSDGRWLPGLGNSATEEGELDSRVALIPITAELLATQQSRAGGASAMPPSADLLRQIGEYQYLIGKGDILHITVYDHPELTMPAGTLRSLEESGIVVRNDGGIFYPYIGQVQVEGRPVEQLREMITERLAEFITDPQVDVRVVGFRAKRAFVTGQVNEPGPLPITNVPLTVLDAIGQAGGLTENANWHEVVLAREDGAEVRLSLSDMLNGGRLDQNLLLRHGDVLHVQDIGNNKVFVMGELNRINSLPMGNLALSLTDALTQSGGINQVTANASGIFVIRPQPPTSAQLAEVYQLDARNALALALGSRFMLQAEDIVFVTAAPVTRWNRVLSQLVPSLSSLILIERLGDSD